MALRDRTLYTRRMGGLTAVESIPAAPAAPTPHLPATHGGPVPVATISAPVERPAVVDRTRATMSREAADLK